MKESTLVIVSKIEEQLKIAINKTWHEKHSYCSLLKSFKHTFLNQIMPMAKELRETELLSST